ncbi:MAG: UvrD-helicase domain-containing protein [Candidatus Eisenbacteria sp.]|nr:UvrD-helicase domain-containing protein [Candidatus Eisenbacteria bacterium]
MTLENYDDIVTHDRSATLVLAGPGAGKTYLLADRVKRLLESGTSKDTITVLNHSGIAGGSIS